MVTLGVGRDERLASRCLLRGRQGRDRLADGAKDLADLAVAPRQVVADLGDIGIGLGERLQQGLCPPIRLEGLGPSAGVAQYGADLGLAVGELLAEFGDGGIVLDQAPRGCVVRPRTPPAPRRSCRARATGSRSRCSNARAWRRNCAVGGVVPDQRLEQGPRRQRMLPPPRRIDRLARAGSRWRRSLFGQARCGFAGRVPFALLTIGGWTAPCGTRSGPRRIGRSPRGARRSAGRTTPARRENREPDRRHDGRRPSRRARLLVSSHGLVGMAGPRLERTQGQEAPADRGPHVDVGGASLASSRRIASSRRYSSSASVCEPILSVRAASSL